MFFLIHCICKKNCNLLCTITALKSQAIYQVVIRFLHIKPLENFSLFFLRFKKMQKKIWLAQKEAQGKTSFIKPGNKRSLWYHVSGANNPQCGTFKIWKVRKSRKFKASLNLQPTGLQKNPLWAGSSYGGFLKPLFGAHERGCWGCRWSVSPEGGTMTRPGPAGRRTQGRAGIFVIKESAFIYWWHPETMSRNTKQRVGEREGQGKPGLFQLDETPEGDYFAY